MRQTEHVYDQFIREFDQVEAPAINLNPESRLRRFPFGTMPAPSQMPTVVAYYTPEYAEHAARLQESLRPWGLKRHIVPVESRGSWQANTQFKAEFLARMLDEIDGPILYVDADATIERYPAFFDGLDTDVAIHRRLGRELLSGTIYLANNSRVRDLLKLWNADMWAHPDVWDQKCLDYALAAWGGRATGLPAPYCAIFDSMPEAGENPVIVHWQASRELKGKVGR